MSELHITPGDASNTAPGAVVPPPNGSNGHSPVSVLGQLKAQAKAQQQKHTLELAVGGEFGERLKIKYKVLEQGPLDRFIAARQAQDKPQMTSLSMSFMSQACINLVGYSADDQPWILEDDQGAVRLEHRLAELLEIVPPNPNPEAPPATLTAHEVILLLFGQNSLAIVTHADNLMEWMQDPSRKPEVGKSSTQTGEMFSPSAPSVESTPGE